MLDFVSPGEPLTFPPIAAAKVPPWVPLRQLAQAPVPP